MDREARGRKVRQTRILVVDQDATVRQDLARLINEDPGFKIAAEAGNAKQALETISKQQVDLVIADVSLDHTGGIQFAEEIKCRSPHVPVLVLRVSKFLEK
jgi:DNA-binding NarL/FixJ family response regulator